MMDSLMLLLTVLLLTVNLAFLLLCDALMGGSR